MSRDPNDEALAMLGFQSQGQTTETLRAEITRLTAEVAELRGRLNEIAEAVEPPLNENGVWTGSLAEAVRAMREENERLTKQVYVPGMWKCAKCACVVISTNLHVPEGKLSANNEPHQCPNDCGPMWHVTERDAGNTVCDNLEKETLARQSAERERDAALAEVERVKGALEVIAEERDAGRHDGLPEPCPAHDDVTMWALARAALTPREPDNA